MTKTRRPGRRSGRLILILSTLWLLTPAAARGQSPATISGTVTDAATGTGLTGTLSDSAFVQVFDAAGALVTSGPVSSGAYSVTISSAGTYFLRTTGPRDYISELHSDIPCIALDCRVTNGTPVTVTAGSMTTVNFALSRGGQITGTVRTADSAMWPFHPIVRLYNASGSFVTSAELSTSGLEEAYTLRGLASGTYYLSAEIPSGYLNELYGGLRCPEVSFIAPGDPPCNVTFGAPIAVTAGATSGGIDVALDPGATLTGIVTGEAAERVDVTVFVSTAAGDVVSSGNGTGGAYTITGLPSGRYRVRVAPLFSDYVGEWSDGLCVGCDGLPGTVALTEGVTTTLDFSLARGGAITGALPPCCTTITAYDSQGRVVRTAEFPNSSQYIIRGLPDGTYYLRETDRPGFGGVSPTRIASGDHGDYLYGGVPCMTEDCDVRRAAPIVVRNRATVTGVDFPVRTGASFGGALPPGMTVEAYDARGLRVVGRLRITFGFSFPQMWGIVGVPEGVYYVRLVPAFLSSSSLPIQVYGGPICSDCAVTSGTPIYARVGTSTTVTFPAATGRAVRGHVLDAGNASPLSTITVEIVTRAGTVVGAGTSDATGLFIVQGLAPGTYYARTANDRGYVDEVYDNVACGRCEIARGMPIVVRAGADTSGIDFALARGTRLSGHVTGAGPGLPGAELSIFDTVGHPIGRARTSPFGQYAVTVPPGSVFGRSDPVAGYRQVLYRDLPCAGGACDPTTGTPINASGASVTGIDFPLPACPAMTIAPVRLAAAAVGTPYRQGLSVSGGTAPMRFSVTTGRLPSGLTLEADTGVLAGVPTADGHQDFTVSASDARGCVASRAYALDVPACPFVLERSSIAVPAGGATSTVAITGACGTTTAVSSDAWIRVVASTATGFQVGIDPNGSTAPRTGAVTVGPRLFSVLQAGTVSTVPFGVVETPADGANVTGSVAVSGWTLDDIGVVQVSIFRDPVQGEPGGALIPIGRTTFVEGARPDVEAAFPLTPDNRRAGWGYLLLTNMLPNGGNGTFRLHAYAEDAEHHLTLIGTKTINARNATATLPFGAIDTPAQGGAVSGTSYVNFGWALTPQPQMIPASGSTIQVFIDGAPIGALTEYNLFRSDVSTLFPGLKNSAGPVGYRSFDTTTLEEGIHTIAWSVTDDGGRAEGIGSRYFFVSNSAWTALSASAGATEPPAVRPASRTAGVDVDRHAAGLRDLPVSRDVILQWRERTWVPLDMNDVNGAGERTLEIRELERVELNLAAGVSDACAPTYAGYAVANGRTRELPAGASIEPAGRFYWQPGAGFLGTYHLLFVRTACDGRRLAVPVSVSIR